MKKTSEKKSEVRTSEAKEIVFTIAVLIILLTAIALYLNSDFYKDKVLATNISNISIALEEVGYINDGAVRYEESQDKYIIETSAFKKKVSSHKLILCEEISSCLNGSTNFIILSDGIEYYCDYTDTYGLVLYVDGGQIYSEKEQEERESAASSSSGSSSTTQGSSGSGEITRVKTEKTCQWAGCYNDREGLNEYCSYHSNYLRGVNEAVEGF